MAPGLVPGPVAVHMETFPRSPETQETYREFLLTRGPTRLRRLVGIGLVATPVMFALDVLNVQVARAGELDVGAIALARLPWVLLPLVLLSVRELLTLTALPRVL